MRQRVECWLNHENVELTLSRLSQLFESQLLFYIERIVSLMEMIVFNSIQVINYWFTLHCTLRLLYQQAQTFSSNIWGILDQDVTFNIRYLTFTTLLSHHYDLSKFIEDYVDQLKTLSQHLQEMNSIFSDWVILTVLLNNLEFTFNVFVMTKRQFIHVTTSTFDFLIVKLIDETRMKNNKSFVVMAFHDKSKLMLLSLQCSHCKKTDHEKPMCFAKYPHKKKKLNAAWAAKKKGKLSSSDKFLSKFFNNVKSIFNKTGGNATTLSFMSVIGSHLMSVWIVDTEASDHLCSTCKFFLTYEPISRSLKTVNEPAQIIEKGMVSLHLVHSDGGIQEVILKDVMHASDFSANLVFDCCMRVDGISFDMRDCTLCHKNNVIKYTSEVNRIFQLHLNNTPQSHAFAANCGFKVLFDMWHQRLSHLGHTNIKRLSKIINSIDLKNLSQWHDVCELCMKVKQTCHSYNASIKWATQSLGLFHLNVVELITLIVYDSSRWFVTLTDNFTRFI